MAVFKIFIYIFIDSFVCVSGGEPIPFASSKEESSDRQLGENEPAALSSGQQILPP